MSEATPASPAKLSLLVVDDDEVDRLAIVRAIRGIPGSFALDEAATLGAAIAQLEGSSYDCVICDFRLPDGEAVGLLDVLRRDDGYLRVPVIVVTGLDERQTAQEIVKGGAQDYLHKSELSAKTLGRCLRHAIQRHELVSELQRREELLRQSQRLEAIEKLAGGIAHDFNNMLTVIGGFSSVALLKIGPDHAATGDLNQVIKATDRLSELTTEIMTFASHQVVDPEIVSLRDLVAETRPLLARLLKKKIELSIGGDGLGEVEVDRGSFQQVLLNLGMNAADAMPDGGSFDLLVEDVSVEAGEIPELEAGPYVRLSVRDTGAGMAPEVASRVFDPFFTTKRFGTATGLGLATVHGILRQCQGAIAVESALGQGTTFRVWVPRVDNSQPTKKVSPSAAHRVMKAGERTILVAEDEPMVRALLRDALLEAGYKVMTAGDGAEALEVARKHTGGIDLLITDVVMPVMGGIELAAALEVDRPETPILFVSGFVDGAGEARLTPGINFFPKPVSPEQLVKAAEDLIGSSPGLEEDPDSPRNA